MSTSDRRAESTAALLQSLKERLTLTGLSDIRYIRRDISGAHLPEFPDGAWPAYDGHLTYSQDDPVLWVRFRVIIPEQISGIPVAGTQTRLRFLFKAPTALYVDGRLRLQENSWLDSQAPEIVLSDAAVPGTVYHCAIRIDSANANWGADFEGWIEYDRVDKAAFDLECMAAECQYIACLADDDSEIAGILDEVLGFLDEKLVPVQTSGDASQITEILQAARRIAEPVRAKAKATKVHLIGHAHIDMNWLWGTEETRDVVYRDFTTVCNLMEELPDFCFSQSQCATYEMTRESHPQLFERVRGNIAAGRWDVTASAWVENDCNMPSGESMARHILYSQRFMDQYLSTRAKIMWSPDTFGHSANLPQLLCKSGITRYFHSRCYAEDSSDYIAALNTSTPSDVIRIWEGIDGSRVLDASVPYSGNLLAKDLTDKAQKAATIGLSNALHVFGVGDHGGGPTRRDITNAMHCVQSPMMPDVIFDTTDGYFSAVEGEDAAAQLPVHKGEMNFVFEGCYTSHADIKKANRLLESRLADVETLCLMAAEKGMTYPAQALEECWRTLLFHQFHDIMDGCAVSATYVQAQQKNDEALRCLDKIRGEALALLTDRCDNALSCLNLLPYKRSELLEIELPPDSLPYAQSGELLPYQLLGNGRAAVWLADLPAYSARKVVFKPGAPAAPKGSIATLNVPFTDALVFDTDFYYLSISRRSGEIENFYDKRTGRYIVKQAHRGVTNDRGILNTFSVVHEVNNYNMSAWMIDPAERITSLKKGAVCNIIEDGELVKVLQIKHVYGASTICQTITFNAKSPLIRFDTSVDWHEIGAQQIGTPVLRVDFNPNIACRSVVSEIPLGTQERPVVGAHYPQWRWSALGDEKGGLILYNDCKYGVYSIGSMLSLELIRGCWGIDQHSDIGEHSFTYWLGCYDGPLEESDVLQHAAECHSPVLTLPDAACEAALPFNPDLSGHFVLSGLKKHEDSGAFAARIYEAFGMEGDLRLQVPGGVSCIFETETDEKQHLAAYPAEKGFCTIPFRKYEIKTLLIG